MVDAEGTEVPRGREDMNPVEYCRGYLLAVRTEGGHAWLTDGYSHLLRIVTPQ